MTRNSLALIGFAEGGRAWLDAEESDTWHYGYGGGLSLALRSTGHRLTATIGRSAEGDIRYLAGFGWSY